MGIVVERNVVFSRLRTGFPVFARFGRFQDVLDVYEILVAQIGQHLFDFADMPAFWVVFKVAGNGVDFFARVSFHHDFG